MALDGTERIALRVGVRNETRPEKRTRPLSTPIDLRISVETALTQAMRALRLMSYEDHACDRDAFDERSFHVTAWHRDEPVGMVRITPGPPFALVDWSGGSFIPPVGADVELTRGIVHPECRRFGIYKFLMIESMLWVAGRGLESAVAAVNPDFQAKAFLSSLGFVDYGAPVLFDHYFFAQPIACVIGSRPQLWASLRAEHLARIGERGARISFGGGLDSRHGGAAMERRPSGS